MTATKTQPKSGTSSNPMSHLSAESLARFAALDMKKLVDGKKSTDKAIKMAVKLISSEKIKLDHNTALTHLELAKVPGDRGLMTSQTTKIVTAMLTKTFRHELVMLASAYCKADGLTYRANGKHTCMGVLSLPDTFEHQKVTLNRYECDTLDDVRALYGTYDQAAPRSKRDVLISLLHATSQFANTSDRTIRVLGAGLSTWLWPTASERSMHSGHHIAHLMQTEYVVPINRVAEIANKFGGYTSPSHDHMPRAAVFAAMLETSLKHAGKLKEFWYPVITGVGIDDEQDPRLKLRGMLRDHFLANSNTGTQLVKKAATSDDMYCWCVDAWNAWRMGQKVFKKKGHRTSRPTAQ